ncbi:MAG: S8 family serine peptidase [Kiloniellaceae bacterium]
MFASRRSALPALCWLLVVAFSAAEAPAQQAPKPSILGIGVIGCVDFGARIVVRGSGFGRAGGRAVMLRDPNASVELPVGNWTDRSITATVPRSPKLIPGNWYQLGIQDKRSGDWISAQRRPLQICAENSAGIDADGNAGAGVDRPGPRDPGGPPPRRPTPQTERPTPPGPTPPGPTPLGPTPPGIAPPPLPGPAAGDADRLADEVLAIVGTLADATALAQQVTTLGYAVRALQELPALGFALLRLGLPSGQDVPTALAALRQAFPATLFDANALYEPDAASQTAAEPRQYAKGLIGWRAEETACDAEIQIGLIDTAVDLSHPAFAARRVTARSFIAAGVPPAPPDHGTAVAAIIVGAPRSAVGGLLPAARLYAAAIFSTQEDGRIAGTTDAIARSVDWLGQEAVRIVNLSLSGPGNQILRVTAERAAANGMILVAAAGNEGPNAAPVFPAGYAPVMAVTAVDAALRPYQSANRGDYIDLAAPGVDVWSARGAQGGRYNSGTSFATPYVSAAAAVALAGAPDASPDAIRQALRGDARDLGEPGRDSTFGWGLVQRPPGC